MSRIFTRIGSILLAAIVITPGSIASAAPKDGAGVIAVLPFENRAANGGDVQAMRAAAVKEFERKGWTVAPEDRVEEILEANRVRFLDSVDAGVRQELAAKLGVTRIVFGTLYTYRGEENPLVALSARMIDSDGRLLWGNVAGISAADTERVMGLGRTEDVSRLAQIAIRRLFGGAPRPGDRDRLSRGPDKPLYGGSARSFESKELARGQARRICVLPVDSASSDSGAARIVSDVLSVRLAATGLDVVEAADFRAAMRAENLKSFRGITPSLLVALSDRLGATLFVRGTIYEFRDAPARSASVPPEIDLELSIVNVADGRVVWSSMHQRNGLDYRGILMLGAASNAVTLTDHVVSEMVRSIRVSRNGSSSNVKNVEIRQ